MKNLLLSAVIASAALFSTSCSSDDDGPRPNQDPAPAIAVATQGTWRITNFEDNGIDKTADYAGFNFTFNNENVIAVDGNGQTITGSWSIVSDDDFDVPEDSNLDFNIFFQEPASFRPLNEDWDIATYSETRIELQDLDDDGPSDYLVLERN
ncbi:hypothetical protein [Flavobacterium selenitireducens]|uniref:hypothetical protein n=1 Tax=Flavobacterium selenitireducens TaxID=2722704 RepID=UPI00168B19B7|nr:hypothetical protein [Flavobacterium selenitireducens]MBD3583293.1 hypothetical protein [Flavobacterium selenitireducens]